MGVKLFGTHYASPIFLCPLGSQRTVHPEDELASARAAKGHDALQVLSTVSSTAVEDVNKARGAPVWYQLYTSSNLKVGVYLAKRAEAAGCQVLAVTVDLPLGRNTETLNRAAAGDNRACTSCHRPMGPLLSSKPCSGTRRPWGSSRPFRR